MTEENTKEEVNVETKTVVKSKVKAKRDIFRFNGEKPTALNLEHVTNMGIEGRRITFNFYTTALFVDLDNDETAKHVFEQLLNVWAADVVE